MVSVMADLIIRDFHAHIYFDPEELEQARKFAAAAQQMFGVPVGHFHQRPVGPGSGPAKRSTCPCSIKRWECVR
jgi:DOPA 4,5-dioxygenase